MSIRIPRLRNGYNYDRDIVSYKTGLQCLDGSRTHQEFKEECDINTIVRNFGLTGELPTDLRTPLQGDFTEVTDYQGALALIDEAAENFARLPSAAREKFRNDPGAFVAFCSDPQNLQALKDMGLGRAERVVEPLIVRVVPDPTPPATKEPSAPSNAS